MVTDYRHIEPINGLGTTWYERGAAYWARRVGLAAMFLLLTLIGLGGTVGLLVVGWRSPSIPLALNIGLTVVAAAAAAWAAMKTERSARVKRPRGRDKATNRGLWGVVVGLLGLARMTAFGLVVLALCAPLMAGGMGVVLLHCLGREYGDEHAARARLETRRTRHGNPAPQRRRR